MSDVSRTIARRSQGRSGPPLSIHPRKTPQTEVFGVLGLLGTALLLEIPVNCESYNLAFVPDILTERGLDVPQTWDD